MSNMKPINSDMPVHLQLINDWLNGLKNMKECEQAITILLRHPVRTRSAGGLWAAGPSNLLAQATRTLSGNSWSARLGNEGVLVESNDRMEVIVQIHQQLRDLGYIYLGHK